MHALTPTHITTCATEVVTVHGVITTCATEGVSVSGMITTSATEGVNVSGIMTTCATLLWLPPEPQGPAESCPHRQRPLPVMTGIWPTGATWLPEHIPCTLAI